jgi:phenylpropionate dioxygenase-like ring-hydroxylating dioxygenase large terminal subunit
LVAFRDTDGKIGLVDEVCPHRGASLFLGRNEECGLRCVFHGWKFDVAGNCVDMMNEPPESNYKNRIRLTAYPTVEMGGVVWGYLGPKERTPAPPKFEWTQVPESHRHVSKIRQDCNWLQGLEGGIDTAHAPILHRTLTTATKRAGMRINSDFVTGKPPSLELDLTDYGYRYADPVARGTWRVWICITCCLSIRSGQAPDIQWRGRIRGIFRAGWKIDDENCMVTTGCTVLG